MSKRLFVDLLLVTLLMGAALCFVRGFLQSSITSLYCACALVLASIPIWLKSRRASRERELASDDDTPPRDTNFE